MADTLSSRLASLAIRFRDRKMSDLAHEMDTMSVECAIMEREHRQMSKSLDLIADNAREEAEAAERHARLISGQKVIQFADFRARECSGPVDGIA